MNKIFELAFKKLIDIEGGYSDHEDDYGGKTKYGLTENQLNLFCYDGKVKDLTKDEAKELYYKHFWKEPKINKIKNRWIQMEIFEQGVNMGPSEAIERLQKAYNILTGEGITEDGIIGPQTLKAVNTYSEPNKLYKVLNCEQYNKYKELVKKDDSQRVFLLGWLNRVNIIKE